MLYTSYFGFKIYIYTYIYAMTSKPLVGKTSSLVKHNNEKDMYRKYYPLELAHKINVIFQRNNDLDKFLFVVYLF